MRIMTIDALELRVTTAVQRVGILHRIPRGHASGERRPAADVTATARPIDIGLCSPVLNLSFLAFDRKIGTRRNELWRNLARAVQVNLGAQVARFATDAQSHRMLRGGP